jgi:hypothetical protein
MINPESNATQILPTRRKPLFLVGVLLIVLGPVLNFVQTSIAKLTTPWYLPILATAGVACLIVSLRQRRSVIRIVFAALFTLLCGAEWYMLLIAAKTPPYTGPAQVGSKVPEFSGTLPDGSAFTNDDLAQGGRTALIFNRGRW